MTRDSKDVQRATPRLSRSKHRTRSEPNKPAHEEAALKDLRLFQVVTALTE